MLDSWSLCLSYDCVLCLAGLQDQARGQQAKTKAEEERWADVPAWKRSILEAKEQQKREEEEVVNAAQRKKDTDKAHFESLPKWKQDLLRKKGQSWHVPVMDKYQFPDVPGVVH